LVGDAPFRLKFALKVTHPFETRRLRQISAYSGSTVRDKEKSSLMRNRKSTTGFATNYGWSGYVTPKSLNEWLKKRFFCFLDNQSNKVCYITKFLCVKTSRGKIVAQPFPYLKVHRYWRET